MKTWSEVIREIPEIIRFDISNNNLDLENEDGWYDYAHEWADGAEEVIYYHNACRYWMEETEVQNCEDEASEMIQPSASIDERIAVCVYIALRNRVMEAIEDLKEEASA